MIARGRFPVWAHVWMVTPFTEKWPKAGRKKSGRRMPSSGLDRLSLVWDIQGKKPSRSGAKR